MAMRLSRSIVGKAEADAVARIIIEDGYLGMGKEVQCLEEDIAAYLGVPASRLAAVNTGTAALTLAVDATAPGTFGKGVRGSVLVPSLTFVASFQAVTAAGCRPIACEVLPETGTIDLDDERPGSRDAVRQPVQRDEVVWDDGRVVQGILDEDAVGFLDGVSAQDRLQYYSA